MSQSTTSSVDVWLDGQPDLPQDYALAHPQTSHRKRKRHTPGPALSQYSHQRRRLMEVSGNILRPGEQSAGRKSPSKQRPRPTTPTHHSRSTRAAHRLGTADPITDTLHELLDEDPEETPMPRNQSGRTPSLRARPPNLRFKPSSQEESLDSRESRDSKLRSKSPTKRLGDFQFSDMPVDSRAWSADAIPEELMDLVNDMERISVGIGVVPPAVRDRFAAVKQTVHDFQWARGEADYDGKKAQKKETEKKETKKKKTEKRETEKATAGLGHALFWHRVSMIHKATIECLAEGYPESAWNSEVHSSILRLALEGLWETREVWYADVTSARISNKSLVPWNIATGAMQSKMVDYAIVIRPSRDFKGDASQSLHQRIIEKLRSEEGGESINQTAADYVRFKPIGVNIETKKGAVGEDEAHVQLGTWLTAQYSRLRQLVSIESKAKLPSLPVLSVQGHRWLLMITCIHENNRIDLVKELDLGSTRSIVGVYQVVAAIRRIAQWVRDDYRPWFEREVLGMKNAV